MPDRATTILLRPESIRIPARITDLVAFRSWARSDEFPSAGRIDWVGGDLEVDVTPEELNTHGSAKAAIARELGRIVEEGDLGVVYTDATRLSSARADLSAEPDVVAIFFESIDDGLVRLIPKAGSTADRFVEIEGAADLVVECVSDSSVEKDTRRLLSRYDAAGVRECWLVDARGETPVISLHDRGDSGFGPVAGDQDGFVRSTLLGLDVRLVRRRPRSGLVRYRLETREA